MSVTFNVKGVAEAKANILQALNNIRAGTERALDVTADATLADNITNSPYDYGNTEEGHVHLKDQLEKFSAPLTRQVGSNVPYHIFLELGTHKMAAQPATQNAFEANKDTLISECQNIKVL